MMLEYKGLEGQREPRMNFNPTRSLIGALALASTALATPALATEGYFQAGYGTVQKAEAGAGVANPQDAMALSINPAGLVDLPHMITGGVTLFMPFRGYSANGPGGLIAPGAFIPQTTRIDSIENYFLMPHFAYSMPIDGDTAWGVAMFGNGGMNTTYQNVLNTFPTPNCAGGVYCGGNAGVDLKQMFLSAGFAKRFGPVSVGVAPVLAVQMFKAEGLGQFGFPFGGFFPPGFLQTFSADPFHLTNNGVDMSYGGGLRAGVQWNITPSLRVGVSGQTPLWMTAFKKYAGLFAGGGKFNIPANITAGVAFDVLPTLTVMAEYKHIFYRGVPAIANSGASIIVPFVVPAGPGGLLGAPGGPGFGWRDVDVYTVGAEWRVTPQLALRAGYAHNTNPVRWDQVTFNILAPGVVTDHITAGLGYKYTENLTFDLAMSVVPTKTVTGPEMTPFGYNIARSITLSMHQFEGSLGVSYKFGDKPRPVVAKY